MKYSTTKKLPTDPNKHSVRRKALPFPCLDSIRFYEASPSKMERLTVSSLVRSGSVAGRTIC